MSVAQLDALSFMVLADALQRSLYVTVMCLLAALASLLLGRRLPYLQLALWTLVLVRAVLPTSFALPFSLRELLAPALPDLFGFVELRLRLWDIGFSAASPPIWQSVPWLTWHIGLVAVWALVATILLVRFALRRRFYRLLLQRGVPLNDAWLAGRVEFWRARYGIRRPVAIRVGGWAVSPFTMGLLRPAVYLPRRLLRRTTRADMDAVIGHELAHVRRHDDFWILLQAVLKAVFFFLPPLWLAIRQMARQRELVCDQMAVRQGELSARAYAGSLVEIFAQTAPGPSHAASAHLGSAWFCSLRIRAVGDAVREGGRGLLVTVLALALVTVLVLPMEPHNRGWAAQAEKFERRAAAAAPAENPGFLWPMEGVVVGEGFGAVSRDARVSYVYHSGLDLIAPVGTRIQAIADGEVERVVQGPRDSFSARTGGYVRIRHGEYRVDYTYLQAPRVAVGDVVTPGMTLGSLGPVPFSPEGKPAHMHLEVTRNGISIDPLTVLQTPRDQRVAHDIR